MFEWDKYDGQLHAIAVVGGLYQLDWELGAAKVRAVCVQGMLAVGVSGLRDHTNGC